MNHEAGVEAVFQDIEDMITECRFADCTHTNEPGCRICEALSNGSLDADRWNSYLKLSVENSYNSDSEAYLLQKRERFKQIAKWKRTR